MISKARVFAYFGTKPTSLVMFYNKFIICFKRLYLKNGIFMMAALSHLLHRINVTGSQLTCYGSYDRAGLNYVDHLPTPQKYNY